MYFNGASFWSTWRRRGRLDWDMGLLRLFLALVVAQDHYRVNILHGEFRPYMDWLKLGLDAGHAVLLFYAISGFLISYALEHKYRDAVTFWQARFVRIYPLFWALFIFAWLRYGPGDPLSAALIGSDWVVAFTGGFPFPPYLAPAWTLGAEVTFYAMAPFLLRSTPACIALLLASITVRLYTAHDMEFAYHFFPATLMFFLLGHFAQKIIRLPWQLGAAIFVAGAWYVPGVTFDSAAFYVSLAGLLLLLPGLFHATKSNRWLNFLGDLSYPVYLSHMIVLGEMYFGLGMTPHLWIFLPACVILAAALHLLIEVPCSRYLPSWLRSFSSSSLSRISRTGQSANT